MTPKSAGSASPNERASELLAEIQRHHPFPLGAMLALTERCNLSCSHCYVPKPSVTTELNYDEIVTLLDELADLGTLLLTLTGGEPALREDLEEIVTAAVERRFSVKLKSNATLLDEQRIDRLAKVGLREIHVSLHDDRPERHDEFVGLKGAWQRAIRTMEHFREHDVRVQVACSAMRENADRIPKLIDICEERGFTFTVDSRVSHRSDGDLSPCRLRASEGDLGRIMTDPRLFEAGALSTDNTNHPDDEICRAGEGTTFIRPDGQVVLCPFLPWAMGNVRETRFREIWLRSEARQRFREIRWGDLPECSSCDLSWACSRCPGSALAEAGDITAASPVDCAVARARAQVCRAELKKGEND